MPSVPFPISGDDLEELRRKLQEVIRQLFEDKIGGLDLGDVFSNGGDILTLNIGTGLKKLNKSLDVQIADNSLIEVATGIKTYAAIPDGNATHVFHGNNTWSTSGIGDFVGPGSSTAHNVVTFANTTGKLGEDSGVNLLGGLNTINIDNGTSRFYADNAGTVNLGNLNNVDPLAIRSLTFGYFNTLTSAASLSSVVGVGNLIAGSGCYLSGFLNSSYADSMYLFGNSNSVSAYASSIGIVALGAYLPLDGSFDGYVVLGSSVPGLVICDDSIFSGGGIALGYATPPTQTERLMVNGGIISSSLTSGKMAKATTGGKIVDATNTDSQVATAVSQSHVNGVKSIKGTVDISLTTTPLDVTGFGFQPTGFIAFGIINGTFSNSQGNDTQVMYTSGATGLWTYNNTGGMVGMVSGGNLTEYTFNSYLSDGIRFTVAKTGVPTGTLVYTISAWR